MTASLNFPDNPKWRSCKSWLHYRFSIYSWNVWAFQ